MVIQKSINGTELSLALEGRLDTMSSPELDAMLKESLEGVTSLVLDFEKLEYISSAGLRVLLSTQKAMNRQGGMKLIHVGEMIMEIFDVTGLTEILTIE